MCHLGEIPEEISRKLLEAIPVNLYKKSQKESWKTSEKKARRNSGSIIRRNSRRIFYEENFQTKFCEVLWKPFQEKPLEKINRAWSSGNNSGKRNFVDISKNQGCSPRISWGILLEILSWVFSVFSSSFPKNVSKSSSVISHRVSPFGFLQEFPLQYSLEFLPGFDPQILPGFFPEFILGVFPEFRPGCLFELRSEVLTTFLSELHAVFFQHYIWDFIPDFSLSCSRVSYRIHFSIPEKIPNEMFSFPQRVPEVIHEDILWETPASAEIPR